MPSHGLRAGGIGIFGAAWPGGSVGLEWLAVGADDVKTVDVQVAGVDEYSNACTELADVAVQLQIFVPTVQIKNVPEQTHAVLRQRAAAAHQSLQEYLRARLVEEASRPTLDEILDRAGGRAGGSVPLKAAVAAVRSDRARR